MAMPRSVVKFKRNGVEFTSSVDKAMYSIEELSRAALRDSAKYIRREMLKRLRKLPGMKKNRRLYRSTQYWVRRKESDLQIGLKHNTWYGADSELGTHKQPARGILRDSVYLNIDQIRIIQGQYLSAIADENRVRGLISEEEFVSPDGEE
ncbi:hypothetical protein KHA94_13465 [Bacillus sp. FJAT-49705]|uniref:Phage protein n=1 Tax=Cytobacillus citreus TaxID=2833586 RepID=A0ABS5NTM9_9BACI|nr:hypothetical protein [Cytobacillus citreus]MBS4191192.1 hypothetical protein [Cytobacillus citreus]